MTIIKADEKIILMAIEGDNTTNIIEKVFIELNITKNIIFNN